MTNYRDCLMCGQSFAIPSQKPQQKYCSRECWRLSRLKQVVRTCESCGKEFSVQQNRSDARFCSWECHSHKVSMNCLYCGVEFLVKRGHAHKRKTCSRACAKKLQAQEGRSPMQGKHRSPETRLRVSAGLKRYYGGHPEKHWNYKHGPFTQRRGRHYEWQQTRALCRERDSFTCQMCGVTEKELGKQLSVHHKKPFRMFEYASDANALDNLICLCQSCHMKAERRAKG